MELVVRGVPYDRAMAMDEAEALAHLVVLREIGRPMETPVEWDWRAMRFMART